MAAQVPHSELGYSKQRRKKVCLQEALFLQGDWRMVRLSLSQCSQSWCDRRRNLNTIVLVAALGLSLAKTKLMLPPFFFLSLLEYPLPRLLNRAGHRYFSICMPCANPRPTDSESTGGVVRGGPTSTGEKKKSGMCPTSFLALENLSR